MKVHAKWFKKFLPLLHLIENPQSSLLHWSRFLNGTRELLTHNGRTDCNISKDKHVRSQAITMTYDSLFFLANSSANDFRNKVHSTPSPPFVPNARGVKVPCSTSNTLCRYCLFLSFSCSLNIVAVGLFWFLAEFTCVTRTSKNAVIPRDPNPPALMSNRSSVLIFLLFSNSVSRCQVVEGVALIPHSYKLYWLQMLAGLEFHHVSAPQSHYFYMTENGWEQNSHHMDNSLVDRTVAGCSAYVYRESVNSGLFNRRPCSSIGIALKQWACSLIFCLIHLY